MIEQHTLEGKPVKNATCTIRTDDGGVIKIRVSGSACKRFLDAIARADKEVVE